MRSAPTTRPTCPSLRGGIPLRTETGLDAIVFASASEHGARAPRTSRALERLGVRVDARSPTLEPTRALDEGDRGVWLVRAGAWPVRDRPVHAPPPSATGRPLVAVGRVRAFEGSVGPEPASPSSVYLDARAKHALLEELERGAQIDDALRALTVRPSMRVVPLDALDVHHDDALRVTLVVTTLQQGGAERLVMDVARALRQVGVRTRIVTVARPTRATLGEDLDFVDLSAQRGDPRAQMAAVLDEATRFGTDLVHAHLLGGRDVSALAATGVPIAVTAHNARSGWPEGLAALGREQVALLLACAGSVEREARADDLAPPVRTIWNAVDPTRFVRTTERDARARAWRTWLDLTPRDFVLLAVANPRPQKRLHLLPAIVAATARGLADAGVHRDVRLVIAGAPSSVSATAHEAERSLHAELRALGLSDSVRALGSVGDVATLYAAADALVSTSAYEGLSLAQLEALAAGTPVVATNVGGASECVARGAPIALVDVDAPAETYARALVAIATEAPSAPRTPSLPADFCLERSAQRHAWLYERVVRTRRRRRGGLLLVTNNFSVGGAQSSARRLLVELARSGVRVRAAVLEERAAEPTAGLRALAAEGVPILFAPPPWELSPARSVAALLERVDDDPPDVVLLWNAMPEHKVRLADALLDTPVFDVSPGEMYFASLDRFFAQGRVDLPYLTARDYGARLAGVVVKYRAEADRARATLGAPVHVIANGVHLDVPRARPGDARVPIAIGTAARLSPQKRIEELMGALRLAHPSMPPYELRIAGGAERGAEPYAARLRDEFHDLPVVWLGERPDVPAFLAQLDCFAMISEPAGCPNASLEAMAAALPVVATDVGGASEQIEDGVTGRLVPRGDVHAFGSALAELARDARRRVAWGTAGRMRAEERFDVARMVADYRRLLCA